MTEPSSSSGLPIGEGISAAPLPENGQKVGQLPLEGSGEHAVQALKEEDEPPQRREVDIIKGLSEETLTKGAQPVHGFLRPF